MKTEIQSIAKEPRALIVYPTICASLGGVSTVSHNNTFAWVTLPGHEKAIRVPMSKLPALDKWTAFNLADATQLFLASKQS